MPELRLYLTFVISSPPTCMLARTATATPQTLRARSADRLPFKKALDRFGTAPTLLVRHRRLLLLRQRRARERDGAEDERRGAR